MRKYDNATTVENEGEILAGFQYRSLLSYQAYYHIKDIKYGSKNRSTLDFFPLEHVSKTVIFIHGGYWQWWALLHKDLKCKAPLIEPNLRRNLGKWST